MYIERLAEMIANGYDSIIMMSDDIGTYFVFIILIVSKKCSVKQTYNKVRKTLRMIEDRG